MEALKEYGIVEGHRKVLNLVQNNIYNIYNIYIYMDKMLPPSKDITNKILLDKAIKFGIDKNTASIIKR